MQHVSRFVLPLGLLMALSQLACSSSGSYSVATGTDVAYIPTSMSGETEFAQPANASGVPNFYRVSDDLYRGAVPTAEGMRQLKAMGVKTVMDLRWEGNDNATVAGSGLQYEHTPFWTYTIKESDVVHFLRLATDRGTAPLYVHCRRGADRTGFMCAVYRVVVCGWDREKAIREMTDGGFGFDTASYQNLISYVRTMDVEMLRNKAGIANMPVNVAAVQDPKPAAH